MNSGDQAGTIMATLVWLLIIYSAATVTFLTVNGGHITYTRHDLLYAVLHGSGVPRQDVLHGPGLRAPIRRTSVESEEGFGLT